MAGNSGPVNPQLCQRTFTDKILIMEHIKEKHNEKGRICKVLIRKTSINSKNDEKSEKPKNQKNGISKSSKSKSSQVKITLTMDVRCRFCPNFKPTTKLPMEVGPRKF